MSTFGMLSNKCNARRLKAVLALFKRFSIQPQRKLHVEHGERSPRWCHIRIRDLDMTNNSAPEDKLFHFLFQSAKMFNYAGWRKTCNFIFTMFAAVFIITRLVILPFWYVLTTVWMPFRWCLHGYICVSCWVQIRIIAKNLDIWVKRTSVVGMELYPNIVCCQSKGTWWWTAVSNLSSALCPFPRIIHATLVYPMTLYRPFFGFYFFNGLMCVLQVLQIFWAGLILRMVVKFLPGNVRSATFNCPFTLHSTVKTVPVQTFFYFFLAGHRPRRT